MITLPHLRLEAVCGCVPNNAVDNYGLLSHLIGADKAAAVVKSTGFATRRAVAPGMTVYDLLLPAARHVLDGIDPAAIGGVVVVTFSAPERFPALSVRLQAALGLPADVAALDLSLACGGYPYGLYVAGQLAAATGRRVLLLDGDVQSAHVDAADANTLAVMSDAGTATLVSAPADAPATQFAFYTDGTGGDVLRCGTDGRIRMDGFGVFRFVAGPVAKFLKAFVSSAAPAALFVPHQANMYMVRQLAKTLGLDAGLLLSGEKYANPGSCSVPLTLADHPEAAGRAVLAGFGAGLAASAACAEIASSCRRAVIECDVLAEAGSPEVVPLQRELEV